MTMAGLLEPGGQGAPQDFGRFVNPISIKGQAMPTTLLLAPPGFLDLLTALYGIS